MAGRMHGKAAIVTGAASGIGRATAAVLASEGAAVCCTDLDEAGAAATAQAIRARGGSADACRLDVTSEEDWRAAFARGRVDVLVNSAGIAAAAPLGATSLADWRRVIAVNLDGAFLGTREAVRAMGAAGGTIVHVASASGVKPAAGAAAYSTSKAALVMLCRAAAKECIAAGVPLRINAVCPGGVKTPMWSSQPAFQDLVRRLGSEEKAFEALAADEPGGRFAEPDEIAQTILFLASDASRPVNGAALLADGGYVL